MSTILLIEIVLGVGAVEVLIARWVRRRKQADQPGDAEIMRELRLQVLENVPEQIPAPVGDDDAWAIVMDIGTPAGAASIGQAVVPLSERKGAWRDGRWEVGALW